MNEKKIIQEEAVKLFKKSNNLILEWATGCGKSKATIDIIKTLNKKSKILLVIAELAHRKNWIEEFKKWGMEDFLKNNVEMTTYASLHKYVDTTYNLVILDEGHHINTELKLGLLQQINFDKLLLLSATISNEHKEVMDTLFGEFSIHSISLTEAIDKKILPNPKLYIVKLQLDNTELSEEIIFTRGNASKRKKVTCYYPQRWTFMKDKFKYKDLELTIKCSQKQKYEYIEDQYNYFMKRAIRNGSVINKNTWLKKGLDRKNYLGSIKTDKVIILLNKLKEVDYKYLCFASSIEQAEILGGKNTIHSENKNTESNIAKFQKNKIRNLTAVNMLQQGMNIEGIEVGVIVQLDGVERPFIQKFGRTLRADYPIQFIFIVEGTKDEDYLLNVVNNTPEECITLLEDINSININKL